MGTTSNAFRLAIRDAGLHPPAVIVPDGAIHRFASNGRRGDDAGWYVMHDDDTPAGMFGDWRSGVSQTWRADNERRLPPSERAAWERRINALRDVRERDEARRHEQAKANAARILAESVPAPGSHPYLARKRVGPHGLRQYGVSLVVPVMDSDGLSSLQFIAPDGEKRFLRGGVVRGGHCIIGAPGDVLCIVEGYATAASVHEATGHAVAVAFNAGNLVPVAVALRQRFPALRLIVCADDDWKTPGNPGLTQAREAARVIGGWLAVPAFGPDRPEDATDFNDLDRLAGRGTVLDAVENAAPASDGDDWPPPGRIVGTLKDVPAFDAETLLPDVLRGWIMDEADRMPCPPEFVAVPALVALGSIIGARCAVRPKARDSWSVVPNLWGAIVGDPAAKKSPAWAAALQPLDNLIAAARREHEAAMVDHQTAEVVFKAQKEAIEGRVKDAARKPGKGDPTDIAQELRRHMDQEPKPPTQRRFKTNDCTVEKLGELLRDNPGGLMVVRDEVVGLISSWEREGREGDRAFFLEAWNGNQSFDTDRIGRGHISIPNVCLSLFGGIQPDKLTRYLEQATHGLSNDGMLQRFQLLVYPDARRWEWRDRAPDKAMREAAFTIFDALAAFDPVAWGAAPSDDFTRFPWFAFDADAQAVFIEWSGDLHRVRMPAEDDSIIRQHLAKYEKLFPALALIFQLVECAAGQPGDRIGRQSALRAAAWCEFLEAHARRCYGLLKDDGLRAAQALAAKLKRGALADGFTLRDVRRNQWRDLTTDEAIQAVLDWLEDENWLRGEVIGGHGRGSGRRTTRYSINPKIRKSPNEDCP